MPALNVTFDKACAAHTIKRKPARQLSLLSFNVFTGPPLPNKVAGSLDGSRRLQQQCDAILELSPDIVCLQEVLADGVRNVLVQRLSCVYDATFCVDQSLKKRLLRFAGNAVLLGAFLAVALCNIRLECADAGARVMYQHGAVGPYLNVLACVLAGLMLRLVARSTLWSFVMGDTQPAGLVTLTKRSVLRPRSEALGCEYAEQDGDFMNRVRPRGVLLRQFELGVDGSPLWVANTHADALSADAGIDSVRDAASKASSHRRTQLDELFAAAEHLAASDEAGGPRSSAWRYERARVLVAGDLNSMPELGEVAPAAAAHGFVDQWAVATNGAPCNSWDARRNPLVSAGFQDAGDDDLQCCMDYVLAHHASALRPVRAELVLNTAPTLSDHFGVLVTMVVEPLGAATRRDPLHHHPATDALLVDRYIEAVKMPHQASLHAAKRRMRGKWGHLAEISETDTDLSSTDVTDSEGYSSVGYDSDDSLLHEYVQKHAYR